MLVPIDDVVHFDVVTHSPSTGGVLDADSTPSWAVYEEDNDTAIVSGNFTKRTSLTGNYRASFTASAANGLEAGKWYSVIAIAIVGGVTGKTVALGFRCAPAENVAGTPKVDVTHWLGAAAPAFPTNFALLGIDGSGRVDVGSIRGSALTAQGANNFVNFIDNGGSSSFALIGNIPATLSLVSDWIDGGRLDLIIDAIKAKTDQLTFNGSNHLYSDLRSLWGAATISSSDRAPNL